MLKKPQDTQRSPPPLAPAAAALPGRRVRPRKSGVPVRARAARWRRSLGTEPCSARERVGERHSVPRPAWGSGHPGPGLLAVSSQPRRWSAVQRELRAHDGPAATWPVISWEQGESGGSQPRLFIGVTRAHPRDAARPLCPGRRASMCPAACSSPVLCPRVLVGGGSPGARSLDLVLPVTSHVRHVPESHPPSLSSVGQATAAPRPRPPQC